MQCGSRIARRLASTSLEPARLLQASAKVRDRLGNAHASRRRVQSLETASALLQDAQKLCTSLFSLAQDQDPDMRELALAEQEEAQEKLQEAAEVLRDLLKPISASSDTNALVEISPGVGGTEANLFARELSQMLSALALKQGWRCQESGAEDLELMPSGEASISLNIRGDDAYNRLRLESGVHRVQRIPATEAKDRIHTSTAAVIVLPISPPAGDKDEKLWQPSEIRIDTMRSSGAGGQSVNKTESAVRVTHIPTGIAVRSDTFRNQIQNKEGAFDKLRAHLLKLRQDAEASSVRDSRAAQISGTDRSDKIRTYNFPQDRVTDHRVPVTVHNIAEFMDAGDNFDRLQRVVAQSEAAEHIKAIVGNE